MSQGGLKSFDQIDRLLPGHAGGAMTASDVNGQINFLPVVVVHIGLNKDVAVVLGFNVNGFHDFLL
jgi:hypothetical protein